jgi:hypothetical protein
MVAYSQLALTLATCVATSSALAIQPRQSPDDCPGYKASNVVTSDSGLTATLTLAGTACNVYGTDVQTLKLEVTAESGMKIVHLVLHFLTYSLLAVSRNNGVVCSRGYQQMGFCTALNAGKTFPMGHLFPPGFFMMRAWPQNEVRI